MSDVLVDLMTPFDERFWAGIDVEPNTGCWLWTKATTGAGYGSFRGNGKNISVHRWAYERFVGPIPNGLVIDHLCRTSCCANPAHLEAVSTRTNLLRGIGPTAQAARKTHCKHGHEFTPENTRIESIPSQPLPHRVCRICERAKWKRSNDRRHH